MHHDDEVTLALKVSLSSISGHGFGGLPTFGNREITTTIRLKDGETNMLAGLIRDEERTVLSGVPGLSDLPLIGHLFANNHKETQQTDIILTLTPHIVRVLDLTEADLRPFRLGRDSAAAVGELPRSAARRADAMPPRRPPPTDRSPPTPTFPQPPQPRRRFPQPLAGDRLPRHARSRRLSHAQEAATAEPLTVRSRVFSDLRAERLAAARRATRSRARRSRAASTRLSPSAASAAAISAIPDRRSRLSRSRPRSCVGPLTMMRCGSQRKRSARIALSCSSAKSRSS